MPTPDNEVRCLSATLCHCDGIWRAAEAARQYLPACRMIRCLTRTPPRPASPNRLPSARKMASARNRPGRDSARLRHAGQMARSVRGRPPSATSAFSRAPANRARAASAPADAHEDEEDQPTPEEDREEAEERDEREEPERRPTPTATRAGATALPPRTAMQEEDQERHRVTSNSGYPERHRAAAALNCPPDSAPSPDDRPCGHRGDNSIVAPECDESLATISTVPQLGGTASSPGACGTGDDAGDGAQCE